MIYYRYMYDNLGRIVGIAHCSKKQHSRNIEYGGIRDGVLDVRGIAFIAKGKVSSDDIEEYRNYDASTGRRIK